jgi:hypothetical protein
MIVTGEKIQRLGGQGGGNLGGERGHNWLKVYGMKRNCAATTATTTTMTNTNITTNTTTTTTTTTNNNNIIINIMF